MRNTFGIEIDTIPVISTSKNNTMVNTLLDIFLLLEIISKNYPWKNIFMIYIIFLQRKNIE